MEKLFKLTNNQQTNKTQSLPKEKEPKTTIWTKIKSFFIIIFSSLLVGGLYYSYIFIPRFSDDYIKADKEFLIAKEENTIALSKVKALAKGTKEYNSYLEARKNKKEKLDLFNNAKKRQRFFGFDSFHFFWERFTQNTTILIFAIWVLSITVRDRKKIPKWKFKIRFFIITTFISTNMFTYFWIFQKFQDFNKVTYYCLTLLFSYTLGLIVFIFVKNNQTLVNALKRKLFRVSVYSLNYCEEDKKEKLAKIIEEPI
ncbi:hypothetical protein [Tenacibaculum agarivorans]|uniref:hypothetical protein n=1 Tax=Tenacibaculum agarivorans TaxID=1908389 RepID=UPI00094B9EEA|nr:hypothetical protein [Tenacibaculum agarivorans]